jgi:hypothetical protein
MIFRVNHAKLSGIPAGLWAIISVMRITTIIHLTIFLCANARAATFIAANTNDSRPGSLRQVLSESRIVAFRHFWFNIVDH